jgi:L-lactate dehydrogenase complex protein LldF
VRRGSPGDGPRPATAAARDARPESFPQAARAALADGSVRANIRHATGTIRRKRATVVAEVPDWERLRAAGAAIKDEALGRLDEVLVELETAILAAGGEVHWARDGAEAAEIVIRLVRAEGADEIVKVKSLATDEIRLNEALEAAGIRPLETDLAELIVQLADERPSHLLVPAIHKNRGEIRDVFRDRLGRPDLSDDPVELAEAARLHLRAAFLRSRVAISGANFAAADTGTVCVVESEGNGRMCTTLPETLITVMGIEKAIPRFRDLEVFLQLLPRSATGERMNPYTSLWTGVREGDGPQRFHLVLLDAGRTRVLADPAGRPALRCIRCSACINVCPVYRQTGGHAYHSPYAGPIGAVLAPQLAGERGAVASLPFASSLCGACYEVCPVRIDIPSILVHERAKAVARERSGIEGRSLKALGRVFSSRDGYERAQRLGRSLQRPVARDGWITRFPPGPLAAWGRARDLPALPAQTFREWWESRERA